MPNKIEFKEGDWTSLYIPIIPTDMMLDGNRFESRHLQDFIENKIQIGKVRRIDFVDRDDLEYFDESNPIKAAFIHMEFWFDNYNANILRNALNSKGEHRQRGYHDGMKMNKFVAENKENMFRYFVFKINHKPIPDADGKLNIHQLAALKTKHEEEIKKLKEELAAAAQKN
jgi:hypothetical protein